MTLNSVFINKVDSSFCRDVNEVFRYLGYSFADRMNDNELKNQLKPTVFEMIERAEKLIKPQAVYVCFSLNVEDDVVKFGGYELHSKDLARNLRNCKYVYLFAATIGPKIDLEIQKLQKINATKAVVMQAVGAMLIEKYCDYLCDEVLSEVGEGDFNTKPRFSPGFGDLSLDTQKIFFEVLDCSKKIGLTLMDSLVMAPEKSVTAFVGV